MLLKGATIRGLDQLTARVNEPAGKPGCRLATYRIDGDFFVDIDLPGVDPAGIDVDVSDAALTVRASRDGVLGASPAGTVTRELALDDRLDTDRIDARYEQGVLTLRIPIREKVAALAG